MADERKNPINENSVAQVVSQEAEGKSVVLEVAEHDAWVHSRHDTPEQALAKARELTGQTRADECVVYQAFNSNGEYIGGDTRKG